MDRNQVEWQADGSQRFEAEVSRVEGRGDQKTRVVERHAWMHVPSAGHARVWLRKNRQDEVALGGSDASVVTLGQERITAQDAERTALSLRGGKPGTAQVTATIGGAVRSRLDVLVTARREVSAAFHFVTDTGGKSVKRKAANAGDARAVAEAVEWCSRLFLAQANVSFTSKGVVDTTVKGALGDPVDVNDSTADAALRGARDASADCNVFFVWNVKRRPGRAEPAGQTRVADPEVIIACAGLRYGGYAERRGEYILLPEDFDEGLDKVLAHELGHFMRLKHDTTNQRALMWPTLERTDNRISRCEAEVLNTDPSIRSLSCCVLAP